jgi:hypothetical protein
MTSLLALFQAHPEVATLGVYLAVLAVHVAVGMTLHATRLRDFDWQHMGAFLETDLWSKRAGVMLASFVLTLVSSVAPSSDLRAAFLPAFLTLVAAAAASTAPLLRDTFTDLVHLLTGVGPVPGPAPSQTPS